MAGITGKDMTMSAYADKLEKLDAPKGRSLTQDALRRLFANKAAMVSIFVVLAIILIAFFGPYFLPWNYDKVDWSAIRKPPDFAKGHFMGTDQNGRDVLARLLQGTQMSLIVAGVATFVSVVIGVIYGAVSGYLGGRIDAVMMRFVDVMYALPYILFVIILVVIFGRSPVLLFVGIGALEWLTMARIVRGQTLSLKEREFIEAARAGGAKTWTHHHPPHHPQPDRAGGDLRDADRPRDHHHGELPELSGARRAGAADLARHAVVEWHAGGRGHALAADLPRHRAGLDALVLHLYRRRPAGRARPQGPLMTDVLSVRRSQRHLLAA